MKKRGLVVLVLLIVALLFSGFKENYSFIYLFECDIPLLLKQDNIYSQNDFRFILCRKLYPLLKLIKNERDLRVGLIITPRFINHWEEVMRGFADENYLLSLKDFDELSYAEKEEIIKRFCRPRLDVDLKSFPRYDEIYKKLPDNILNEIQLDKTLIDLTPKDYKDLQTLYALSQLDPLERNLPPIQPIVDKGSGWSENEKRIIWDRVKEIERESYDLLNQLIISGRVELIASFEYIVPTQVLFNYEKLGLKDEPNVLIDLKEELDRLLIRSKKYYKEKFNVEPLGLWPGYYLPEGAFFSDIFRDNFKYALLDSSQLSHRGSLISSGKNKFIQRDNNFNKKYLDTPLVIGQGVNEFLELVHRECELDPNNVKVLSFDCNTMDITDFNQKYYFLKKQGFEFIQPSQILNRSSQDAPIIIHSLWDDEKNYLDCIGRDDLNRMWDAVYKLKKVFEVKSKEMIEKGQRKTRIDITTLKNLYESILSLLDETWYLKVSMPQGFTKDVVNYVNEFKERYERVYKTLTDESLPEEIVFLYPLKSDAARQSIVLDMIQPELDGEVSAGEYFAGEKKAGKFSDCYLGIDNERIYLGIIKKDVKDPLTLEMYLSCNDILNWVSQYSDGVKSEDKLGFRLDIFWPRNDKPEIRFFKPGLNNIWNPYIDEQRDVKSTNKTIEISIPFSIISDKEYAQIGFVMFEKIRKIKNRIPKTGTMLFNVERNPEPLIEGFFRDFPSDDHSFGNLVYPQLSDIHSGLFDILNFRIMMYKSYYKFKIKMKELHNIWRLTGGLSQPVIDIYLDVDGKENSGLRELLPKRNAIFTDEYFWDYAIVISGDGASFYGVNPRAEPVYLIGPRYTVNETANEITVDIPQYVLPEGDIFEWSYFVGVLCYDPLSEHHIREIKRESDNRCFGGAKYDKVSNYLDILVPVNKSQEEILNHYYPPLPMFKVY
ncbi:MAG: glucodextranase DOMON-like domain-containing protein [Candidatus Hydrogenedentota bacterium]